jgi:signal transduction histidine kinase
VSRLHTRIYLHSLGVLLAVGVAVSAVFALGSGGGFWREAAERVTRHVAALVGEVWGDQEALARRLAQLHDDLEVDLTLRELDGRVMARFGSALPALTAEQIAAARAGRTTIARRPAPFAVVPVRAPGSDTVVGILQASPPRRFAPPNPLRPLLAVTAVLLVAALATRPLARRIARPLDRLTEAARRLGGGDLGARVITPDERPRWWRRRHWRRQDDDLAPGNPPSGRRAGAEPTLHPDDELAQLTRAFNDMAERVERTVRGQKELLANVSHELRSPLARIRMALELVPRDAGAAARLADIERDLAELERLIDDVLTAARLEATGLPAHLEEVSVRRLLGDIAERARRDPLTAGMAVGVADGPDVLALADAALLRRALWNLVENAAKYGAPPVILAAAREGDQLRLSVADAGPGIAPADRERVLAPFVRGDAARTPGAAAAPGGVGLGLTLARRVAEVHGGTIAIAPASSRAGVERGCRVTIALPGSAVR